MNSVHLKIIAHEYAEIGEFGAKIFEYKGWMGFESLSQ